MKDAKTVSKANYEYLSLDYEKLREKAIQYAQQFSGNNWTDFNYHDPGVTILEQLCYAITDLAYRTQFPITDLLFLKNEKSHLKSDNLLFPPSRLFPTSPVLLNDYRKLLIGKIPEIKNGWVEPVKDDAAG
ncbi:MAG: diguanylate cyclase, partial [Bacteroidota bacterium]